MSLSWNVLQGVPLFINQLNQTNMNKELLFQLYSIHSPSGSEKKMRKFIKRYISRVCGDCEVVQDSVGNLFVTKGVADSYPCLASHIDQVQRSHSKDFEVVEGRDVVFGYSHKSREQQGLGADDKNGIYVCLECLARYDVLKCAFFVGEEIGCKGSSLCDMTFFNDCRYIVQPDRMGGRDLITSMGVGDVCSVEFANALGAAQFGYREARGSITDVGELVSRGVGISCLNLSCGYYCAHTSEEFTVLSELQNCLDFVCHIVETLTDKVYPFEYVGWQRQYDVSCRSRYSYDFFGERPCKAVAETPMCRDYTYDDLSYYDDGYYDLDCEMMEHIVLNQPGITFEEITGTGGWIGNFTSRDINTLRDIYDDVCSFHGIDDDDAAGELVADDNGCDDISFDDIALRKAS